MLPTTESLAPPSEVEEIDLEIEPGFEALATHHHSNQVVGDPAMIPPESFLSVTPGPKDAIVLAAVEIDAKPTDLILDAKSPIPLSVETLETTAPWKSTAAVELTNPHASASASTLSLWEYVPFMSSSIPPPLRSTPKTSENSCQIPSTQASSYSLWDYVPSTSWISTSTLSAPINYVASYMYPASAAPRCEKPSPSTGNSTGTTNSFISQASCIERLQGEASKPLNDGDFWGYTTNDFTSTNDPAVDDLMKFFKFSHLENSSDYKGCVSFVLEYPDKSLSRLTVHVDPRPKLKKTTPSVDVSTLPTDTSAPAKKPSHYSMFELNEFASPLGTSEDAIINRFFPLRPLFQLKYSSHPTSPSIDDESQENASAEPPSLPSSSRIHIYRGDLPDKVKPTVELYCPRSVFFDVYQGKLDPIKAVLSGQALCPGFRYMELMSFGKSFDIRPEVWHNFYSLQAEIDAKIRALASEGTLFAIPSTAKDLPPPESNGNPQEATKSEPNLSVSVDSNPPPTGFGLLNPSGAIYLQPEILIDHNFRMKSQRLREMIQSWNQARQRFANKVLTTWTAVRQETIFQIEPLNQQNLFDV